ncbi:MAG: hypothetical protein ACJ752_04450 [Gaiellaceae bacterium]
MEDLGVERVHGRPIRLLQLAEWAWEEPTRAGQFTLLVAATALVDDAPLVRRFAADAVASGCAYVCTWGQGCEHVHHLFDEASIGADRFVMSTSHADESLAEALYFALVDALPEEVSDSTASAAILAVEQPWIPEVRRLVSDQEELARLWVAEGE